MEADLFSEASGNRVLTARHIISEKTPLVNDALNTSVFCHDLSVQPDFYSYFSALQNYAWVLWSCGVLVLVAVCCVSALTYRAARKQWSGSGCSLVFVLGVYPVVAASGLVVLLDPRARLLAEAAAQQAVMLAMYHLFCLLVSEAGGEEKLVRRAGGSRLETRVLPCCCWPCCVIPRPQLDRKVLNWLRCLVLQLPIVQGLIYVVILVLWAEDMSLYLRSFIFFQPFVIGSILSGIWGVMMLVRAVEAAGTSCRPRLVAVQLALVAVKVQCGIAKVIPEVFSLPCVLDLNPTVVVHMIQYSIMMVEMLALSIWAWRLYRVPTDDKVRQVVVAVLDDGTGDMKPVRDVIERSLSAKN